MICGIGDKVVGDVEPEEDPDEVLDGGGDPIDDARYHNAAEVAGYD